MLPLYIEVQPDGTNLLVIQASDGKCYKVVVTEHKESK